MKFICEDVTFGYVEKKPIFQDYSHVFHQGITILKGYSGCGKTTLLKLIAGYLPLKTGRLIPPVKVKVNSQAYHRQHVSYMFQGLNLLPLLSIEKNLRLAAEMSLLPQSLWKPKIEQLLTDLGLQAYRKHKANQLSGGQMQRAALARTLMKNPEVLLLDEPTSGLDDNNTEIIKKIILQQGARSICLVSTHDPRLINIADEIIDFNNSLSL